MKVNLGDKLDFLWVGYDILKTPFQFYLNYGDISGKLTILFLKCIAMLVPWKLPVLIIVELQRSNFFNVEFRGYLEETSSFISAENIEHFEETQFLFKQNIEGILRKFGFILMEY